MSISSIGSTNSPVLDVFPMSYYAMLYKLGEKTGEKQRQDAALARTGYVDGPPKYPAQAPALEKHIDPKVLQHINLLMRNYYDHFQDLSLEKEMLVRLVNRRMLNDDWLKTGQEKAEEYAFYVLHMLLERAFLNALARHNSFIQLQEQTKQNYENLLEWNFVDRRLVNERMGKLQTAMTDTRRRHQVDLIAPWARDDLKLYYLYFDPPALKEEMAIIRSMEPKIHDILGNVFFIKAQELQKAIEKKDSIAALKLLRDMKDLFSNRLRQSWLYNQYLSELVQRDFGFRMAAWNQRMGQQSRKMDYERKEVAALVLQAPAQFQANPSRQDISARYEKNANHHPSQSNSTKSGPSAGQSQQNKALSEIAIQTAQLEMAWKNPQSFSPHRANGTPADIMRKQISEAKMTDPSVEDRQTPSAAVKHLSEQLNRALVASDMTWAFEQARIFNTGFERENLNEKLKQGDRVSASKKIGQM